MKRLEWACGGTAAGHRTALFLMVIWSINMERLMALRTEYEVLHDRRRSSTSATLSRRDRLEHIHRLERASRGLDQSD